MVYSAEDTRFFLIHKEMFVSEPFWTCLCLAAHLFCLLRFVDTVIFL